MKPTQFFASKASMTAFAKEHVKTKHDNWYLRTTMPCNHQVNQNRKAIVLLSNEVLVQRLVLCNCCNQFYNLNVNNHGHK